MCSSERNFRSIRFTEVDCFTVTTVNFINDIVFIFCSYSIFRSLRKGVYAKCFSVAPSMYFFNSVSFSSPSGITTFAVVFRRRTKPIRRNRLFAQGGPKTRFSFSCNGYLFTRALVVASAVCVFTTPPLHLVALWNFYTSVSSFWPSNVGRPRILLASFFSDDAFLQLGSLSLAS